MQALVLGEQGASVVEVPFAARPGEAIVRVSVAGVCATDLELVKGYMGFRGVLGHEFVGVVEAAPDRSWVGRRVVGSINAACGACPTCAAGRGSHCPNRTVLGIQGRDGVFATHTSLPMGNLFGVPDAVSDAAAVFVEPLAAACQILQQVHVRPSDRVVVLGSGRLAQLCARVLALVADVTVVGRNAATLARLPDHIRKAPADDVRGADFVVDCTGTSDGLALASSLVRPRGTIVLKTTTHDLGRASPTAWVIDEITVVGSRCGPFAPALRLLAAGLVDPTPLIDAEFHLSDGVSALSAAASPGALKILVRPGS